MEPIKKITVSLLLLSALGQSPCKHKPDGNQHPVRVEPTIINAERSSCLPAAYHYSNRDSVSVVILDGDTMQITHLRARFNCCLDSVKADLRVSGDTLRLLEDEAAANPCECQCYYRLRFTLYPVTPPRYHLEIYQRSWTNQVY